MTTSPFAPDYTSAPEKPLSPVEELWEAARGYLHTAYVMFGGPRVLAERVSGSPKEYRACTDWFIRCEELLRRLIFINALKFFALNLQKFGGALTRASKHKPAAFDPDHPARWRVSFELKYGARAPRRPARNLQNKAHAGEGAGGPYSPTRSYQSYDTKPGDLAMPTPAKSSPMISIAGIQSAGRPSRSTQAEPRPALACPPPTQARVARLNALAANRRVGLAPGE